MAEAAGAGDGGGDSGGQKAAGGVPGERSGAGERRRSSNTVAGTSSDQILQTGAVLLRGFIYDRVQRDGTAGSVTMEELGGTEQQLTDLSTKRLSDSLRRIGDELDANVELQKMIDQVSTDSPKEVFFRVAMDVFSDGNFNWGRVVALFYFACKLVLKALCAKIPELIRTIIGWTMDYLREHLLQWIQEQGGWQGLLSYFGTPTWQTVGVFVAGVLTASLTIWKMS